MELSTPLVEVNKGAVMLNVDGSDDRSVAFAARLLEQNIQVRIIDNGTHCLDMIYQEEALQ